MLPASSRPCAGPTVRLAVRFGVVLCMMGLARAVGAQAPPPPRSSAKASVSGLVHDSIAHLPVPGAIVQIISADPSARFSASAISDSLGRFSIPGVPDGRFAIGFLHPMLDSLGIEAPLRDVVVSAAEPVRVDLAIPSPARLRSAICGVPAAGDSSAMLVGVVRDAMEQAPVSGATVVGEWLEFTFGSAGIARRVPRLVVNTGDNGWFAMCNVPRGGTMTLVATHGADSTDVIDVSIPDEGFARRELVLGRVRSVAEPPKPVPGDTLAPPRRRVRRGDAQLSGTVVSVGSGQPLPGSLVGLVDGPQTRANERGEWKLADVPVGTRVVEVRAIGYYPERRAVNVTRTAPPLRIALSTFRAVLDTVKVSATRLRYRRDLNGFEERRKSSMGRFLGYQEIARANPLVTTDMLRNIPGLRLEYDSSRTEKRLTMRGAFGRCEPNVYIDGMFLTSNVSAEDIDGWVPARKLAAVEIYDEASVPPQFQPGLHGCGSIVIWSKSP